MCNVSKVSTVKPLAETESSILISTAVAVGVIGWSLYLSEPRVFRLKTTTLVYHRANKSIHNFIKKIDDETESVNAWIRQLALIYFFNAAVYAIANH